MSESNSSNEAAATRKNPYKKLPIMNGSEFVFKLPRLTRRNKPQNFDLEHDVCEICQNVLTDPIVLDCEHVFDRGCLHGWLAETEANQKSCPKDRKPLFRRPNDPIECDCVGILNGPGDDSADPINDFDSIRFTKAFKRREGAFRDLCLYRELLSTGGLDMPPLDKGAKYLDYWQDSAMCGELMLRRGAFEVPGLKARFPGWTDVKIYEHLRNMGAFWCTPSDCWSTILPDGFHYHFAFVADEDDIVDEEIYYV